MLQIRKITLVLSVAAFLCSINLEAQTFGRGQLALSGGGSYGLDMNEPGLRGGLVYYLSSNMRACADFTYWPGDDEYTYYEVNANFNYIFFDRQGFLLYGIVTTGIHYWEQKWEMDELDPITRTSSDLGMGAGVGIEYNYERFSVFGEQKIIINGHDQPKVNFGIRYYPR